MVHDVSIRIYDVARHFPILLNCKRIQVLWDMMSLEVLQNPGADAQDSAWEPRHSPSVDHKFLLWPIQRPLSLLLSTAALSFCSSTTIDQLLAEMVLFKTLSPPIKHFHG